jgi:KDO2-lipid IV(A) lauroyltransferase
MFKRISKQLLNINASTSFLFSTNAHISMMLRFSFFCLSKLPHALRRFLGRLLSVLFFIFARQRVKIARRNLHLCFPDTSESHRNQWLRYNIRLSVQSLLDRAWLWLGNESDLRHRIELVNAKLLQSDEPIIVLSPHFLALDAAVTRITLERQTGGIYRAASNEAFEQLMRAGRCRFNQSLVYEKDEGIRPLLALLAKKIPIFYLNDQDHGVGSASFVPFFGISAATVHILPKLIHKHHVKLLLCVSQITQEGYRIELLTNDAISQACAGGHYQQALTLLNQWTESVIRPAPEQYLWMHRRFKTRPSGDPSLYD